MASSDEEGRKETCKMPSSGEWSIDAVYSLLESYGQKFAVGRGFLRNKDWEDVVAFVNSRCRDPRFRKTMKQCRDKVDSLKKRYKVEKRRAIDTGLAATAWPYFLHMDEIMCKYHSKDSGSGSIPPAAEKISTPECCSERKMESLGFKKRRRAEMCGDSVEALAEAIAGFSDVYARMEIAKMEILADMNVQLAKLGRRKKRRNASNNIDSQ